MGIINKPLLLHLVGCLYYCINDARSFKHQIQRDSLSFFTNIEPSYWTDERDSIPSRFRDFCLSHYIDTNLDNYSTCQQKYRGHFTLFKVTET